MQRTLWEILIMYYTKKILKVANGKEKILKQKSGLDQIDSF